VGVGMMRSSEDGNTNTGFMCRIHLHDLRIYLDWRCCQQ
jgi:hypothetical protein